DETALRLDRGDRVSEREPARDLLLEEEADHLALAVALHLLGGDDRQRAVARELDGLERAAEAVVVGDRDRAETDRPRVIEGGGGAGGAPAASASSARRAVPSSAGTKIEASASSAARVGASRPRRERTRPTRRRGTYGRPDSVRVRSRTSSQPGSSSSILITL